LQLISFETQAIMASQAKAAEYMRRAITLVVHADSVSLSKLQ